jgi:hypothetical protein
MNILMYFINRTFSTTDMLNGMVGGGGGGIKVLLYSQQWKVTPPPTMLMKFNIPKVWSFPATGASGLSPH